MAPLMQPLASAPSAPIISSVAITPHSTTTFIGISCFFWQSAIIIILLPFRSIDSSFTICLELSSPFFQKPISARASQDQDTKDLNRPFKSIGLAGLCGSASELTNAMFRPRAKVGARVVGARGHVTCLQVHGNVQTN